MGGTLQARKVKGEASLREAAVDPSPRPHDRAAFPCAVHLTHEVYPMPGHTALRQEHQNCSPDRTVAAPRPEVLSSKTCLSRLGNPAPPAGPHPSFFFLQDRRQSDQGRRGLGGFNAMSLGEQFYNDG